MNYIFYLKTVQRIPFEEVRLTSEMKSKLKFYNLQNISAIVPAHNEESRIGSVLKTLEDSSLFSEIIVVDDASTDNTYLEVQNQFPKLKLLKKKKSTGKADAMIFGAREAKNNILFFCDADLINLLKHHLLLLITPVLNGEVRMTIGAQEYMEPLKGKEYYRQIKRLFNNFGGDGRPYLNDFVKGMGGQRVMFKKDFFAIKYLQGSGYGIEQEINLYFSKNKFKFKSYVLSNVSHWPKFEKWGLLKGMFMQSDYILRAGYHLFRWTFKFY